LPQVAPLVTREEKEREARMLVSDLLDISMRQRKAYEEPSARRRRRGGEKRRPQPWSSQGRQLTGSLARRLRTTAKPQPNRHWIFTGANGENRGNDFSADHADKRGLAAANPRRSAPSAENSGVELDPFGRGSASVPGANKFAPARAFRTNSGMRILLSGVCGFVGSTLARTLAQGGAGHQLCGCDNFIRPGSESNRAGLKKLGVQLFHGDCVRPAISRPCPPSIG